MMRPPLRLKTILVPVLAWGLGGGSLWGGGVTVVTHGGFSDVVGWVIPMAGEMAEYQGDPALESSCYILRVFDTSPATSTLEYVAGKKPDESSTGEIFIKLDWSDGAGFLQMDSPEVAEAAVAALTNPSLIPEMGGRALAELPLHLVGHSRGGSVVSELARELGERGVWVDHLTTLDPHPIFGDPDVSVRRNVLYADNYWQDDGFPDGSAISGAYNRYLSHLTGGYSSSHSDVHLWYWGTAELTTPTSGSTPVTASMRSTWWTVLELSGAEAGYRYSRLGGGNRLSPIAPAAGAQIVSGFNQFWDLGAGVNSNRASLASNSGAWPNVIRCWRVGTGPVGGGQDLELDFYYQAGASASGTIEAEVILDVDRNPLNGNEVEIDGGDFTKTGTGAVSLDSVVVGPGAATPGMYHVALRLEDGSRERVMYVEGMVEVVDPVPPMIDGATVRMEGGELTFEVTGSPGTMAEVWATEDFVMWEKLVTEELVGGMFEFSDAETGDFERRYYEVR